MNKDLLEQIVKHVFANFVIIESKFVNIEKTKSILNKEYLLDKKISFEENDNVINNNIWGCQMSSEDQELKILVGDCSLEKNSPEYCMLIRLKTSPVYGLYMALFEDKYLTSLSCSLNGKDWMECNTYLQATFLAGMEHVKELAFNWNKCVHYDEEYDMMKSYIKYYNDDGDTQDEG